MAKGQAATSSDEITAQINHLLHTEGRYLSDDDLRIKRLQAECTKLAHASVEQAWICRARIAQLCGNDESFDYAIKNAEKLDSTGEWLQTKGVGLLKLHRYSEAQDVFASLLDPRLGWFNAIHRSAVTSGAIRAVMNGVLEHNATGVNMPSDFPYEFIEESANFMKEHEITDKDVSNRLDLAGAVLRSIAYMDAASAASPRLVTVESSQVLHFIFLLKRSPEEVANANVDLALMMAESNIQPNPSLHVSFGSAA